MADTCCPECKQEMELAISASGPGGESAGYLCTDSDCGTDYIWINNE